MKVKNKQYQHKVKAGQVAPYRPDESDQAALDMIYSLRLAKVVVVNNKFAYCTMGSSNFIKQIETINTNVLVNSQLAESLKQDNFSCKIIEGFRNKLECLDYIKTKLSHLTLITKLIKDDEERSEYKILVQRCPTTNKVLVVYPKVSKFCEVNNIGDGWLQSHITKQELIAGYKWEIRESWDYPATTVDLTFQDILKLGIKLPVRGTSKRGKPMRKSTSLIQTDLEDNYVCEYQTIEEAANKLNTTIGTIKDCARKGSKRRFNHKFKLQWK